MQCQEPERSGEPERWPANDGESAERDLSKPLVPSRSAVIGAGLHRPRWFDGLWLGGLLIAGSAATAFAATSLWQLGIVVREVVGVAQATSTSTASPAPAGMPAEAAAPNGHARPDPRPASMVPSVDRVEPHAGGAPPLAQGTLHATLAPAQPFETAAEAPAQPFEATAEASERAVPLGARPESEYVRTECGDVFVYIVSVAEAAPRSSAASLAVGKTSPARFRRPGQRIGDWEVLAITDDWSGANPAVWLLKDNAVCRAELAGNPARVHVPPKPVRKPPASRRRRARRR